MTNYFLKVSTTTSFIVNFIPEQDGGGLEKEWTKKIEEQQTPPRRI